MLSSVHRRPCLRDRALRSCRGRSCSAGCSIRFWATRCRSSRSMARSPRRSGWAASVPRCWRPSSAISRATTCSSPRAAPCSSSTPQNAVGLAAYLFTCGIIIAHRRGDARGAGARQRARRADAGDAGQHRRRGDHHRQRRARHLAERRGGIADRLDRWRRGRPAARDGVSHRQRGHPPARRRIPRSGRCGKG